MLLPDHIIREYLAAGTIEITPFSDDAVRPASYDLRLGPFLKIEDRNVEGGWREYDLRDAPYRLYHGDFVLAATLERVKLPDTLAGILAGKSSRAREGIQVEAAGYVDPGWDGELTMEVTRFRRGESRLVLGMPICQIRFEMLLAPCERPYGSDSTSHYQRSKGPIPSRTEWQTAAGHVAAQALRESLDAGNTIEIPSLGATYSRADGWQEKGP